jgi:hypothetical protein
MCVYSHEVTRLTDYGRILSAKEAAEHLRLSLSKMQRLRCDGGGPEFLKFSRGVGYLMSDLIAWRESNRARSTSEYKLRKL